ncbi:MAG: thiopurine S-methyltransferase [Woeseiaceae bacterium]
MVDTNVHAAWHDRWENGRIGFHRQTVNEHLVRHWSVLDAPGAAAVFVPLCGKAVDLHWLAKQHDRVVGVELSPVAVRDFFAESEVSPTQKSSGSLECWTHDNISIWCGDFFELTPEHLGKVDAFFDRASLIALPEAVRKRYQRHLATLVPAGAKGLTVTVDYPQQQMNGPPFSVGADELAQISAGLFDVSPLQTVDVLANEDKFRERGVTSMVEQVSLLTRMAQK